MLSVQYADSNSKGVLASSIGWINYGDSLLLSNKNNSAKITNSIPGGYSITFDMSIAITGNEPYASDVVYSGFEVPTFGNAPFGTTAYTGIKENVALYTGTNQPIGDEMKIKITLNNILIKDICGNKIDDFLFFAADAETTNQGFGSIAETWSVTSDGTPWTWLQIIPSVSGVITGGPDVTGNFTNTVLETGLLSSSRETSSNIFMTQNPNNIIADTTTDGGREGFVFGIMIISNNKVNNIYSPYSCGVVIGRNRYCDVY